MKNLKQLYGNDTAGKEQRIREHISDFKNIFGALPRDLFSSPGRIEIVGNHTDHNHGTVLVGAISRDILAAVCPRTDRRIVIKSQGFEDITLSCDDTDIKENEKNSGISLVRGILRAFSDLGYFAGGFDALLTSNIFKGAGVSSSAAFEVLIGKVLSYYYADDAITPLQLAKAGQFAESNYFGKPCGLLDQCGIAFGGVNFIDFEDISSPIVRQVNPDFTGYSIVITNSGGDHSLLTPYYAEVKNDMQAVSSYFKAEHLRQLQEDRIMDKMPQLKARLGGRAILRAMHFFGENKRVAAASEALKIGDMQTFLKCVNLSGDSSYKLLQNCYVPGEAEQGIPLALAASQCILRGRGAVRVHGGGFAGTVIAFVPADMTENYCNKMAEVFGKQNSIAVSIRAAGTAKIDI